MAVENKEFMELTCGAVAGVIAQNTWTRFKAERLSSPVIDPADVRTIMNLQVINKRMRWEVFCTFPTGHFLFIIDDARAIQT